MFVWVFFVVVVVGFSVGFFFFFGSFTSHSKIFHSFGDITIT